MTGGGGFIGSHLVDGLLEQGYEVRVLDSFATGRRENLAHLSDIDLVEGDIQSYERVLNAVRDCDVVLHQAALPSVPRSMQDPLMTNAVNITGTMNVLLAARDHGVRRVVHASSSSIYGSNQTLPKVETLAPAPISPYAVSKLAAESYCQAFHRVYALECVALRYFNIFGPRQDPASQYSAVVPRFIDAALDNRRPVIYGDGNQSRDFTFVSNVVDANLRALDAPGAAGEVFNVACGARATLNDMLLHLGRWLEVEIEADHHPLRPGDVRHSFADVSKARSLLGYQPQVTFDEGLRQTLEHAAESRDRVGSTG